MSNFLLIEGQDRWRAAIKALLQGEGHSVQAFASAAEALEACFKPRDRVDVGLIAWDVAGAMSGSEFMMRLRQNRLSFPCIVTTATLDLAVRNRAVALGARDLLLKPIDKGRLCEALRRVLQKPDAADPLVQELQTVLVGSSPAFRDAVVRLAQAIRSTDTAVLLIGESGVGKEIFAQLIHQKSRTPGCRMEAVNVAGFSATLIESELFGHERGAFTGANRTRLGAFERAGTGTLFLDEIGYLEPALQPKLLRVIEQRRFYRVGGNREIPFRARLVCATSRNLATAVQSGSFRQDLYHRISEFEIRIPPLRERKEDVQMLADHFLTKAGVSLGREALAILESYSFPGNVRELQNILKQAMAVHKGDGILPGDLPGEIMQDRESSPVQEKPLWPERLFSLPYDKALAQIEKEFDGVYLPRRIQQAGGNKAKAARLIGITTKTLRKKLRDCQTESSGAQKEEGNA